MRTIPHCGKPAPAMPRRHRSLAWTITAVTLLLALTAAGLAVAAAPAQRLTATIERADAGWLQAEAIALSLRWADDAADGELELRIGSLSAAALGYHLRELRWRCPLQRDDTGWQCAGPVGAHGLRSGRLQLAFSDHGPLLALSRAKARLGLQSLADGRVGWQIDAATVPLDWLQPLLQRVWPQARLTAGTLQADLQFETDGDAQRLHGPIAWRGLGLDTEDGRIAGAGLTSSGRIDLQWSAQRTRIDATLDARGGELLVGPLYAELPATPVGLALRGERAENGRWRFERLHWSDPGVLTLAASAQLQPDGSPALEALQLEADMPDLALAHARYLDALLGSFGGNGLQPRGALSVDLTRDVSGWRLDAGLRRLSLQDARGRFALDGADGRLRWNSGDAATTSQLRWQGAALHGIALGAADLALDSRDGWLRLQQPTRIAALGGALALQQIGWRPPLDGRSPELELALQLVDLDLAALSQRFGWPAFSGRLGGDVPAARYQEGVLQFDGGLGVDVFDGRIDVAALRMQRPFGVAPRLEADIRLTGLDLQPLTAVFGFGEITGRLDGRIAGLQLVDWQPTAFDAELRTSTQAQDKRRISRRAVADLTSIGGGGLAGGIQASALKLFDSFAYRQIGLRCRLANDICEMGGVDSLPSGYTIVEGAGLPRISVIGHQRRVDWPVLVARLKAVSAGQAIRID
jgi:hypothetical protein